MHLNFQKFHICFDKIGHRNVAACFLLKMTAYQKGTHLSLSLGKEKQSARRASAQ